jgi:hypothetical protein
LPTRRSTRLPSREELNLAARGLLRRAARRLGYDAVKADYYSPILDSSSVPAATWSQASPMHGIEFDLDGQQRMIEELLSGFIGEFRPPLHARDGFHLENPWYGPMDAHVLYAMLRSERPGRVLELGSGYSTLVIEQALAANGDGRHLVVDPFPSPVIDRHRDRLELHRESAASVDSRLFTELRAGEVLFVDTSHVVKPGGEVVRVVLDVLPQIAPGVLVHFHDFFRPFEYPRILYDRFNVHWQEHYLLQAFLAYNPHFEILCANHALWRERRPWAVERFPGLRAGMEPSALWLRRRGP